MKTKKNLNFPIMLEGKRTTISIMLDGWDLLYPLYKLHAGGS